MTSSHIKQVANGSGSCFRCAAWFAWSLIVLAGGCRSTAPSATVEPMSLVWPRPPASPRIAYVQSISVPADLGVHPATWRKVVNFITGSDRGREAFVKPQGLAVDELGNLCVADPGARAVIYFDLQRGRLFRWEKIGEQDLVAPVSVAVRNGRIFVGDTSLGKVLAFDRHGALAFEIAEGLERPAGLAVTEDRLLVADALLHRVLVFDLQGKRLGQFGDYGTGPGEFNFPTHVAVDNEGKCYVTDSMNFRVQVFGPSGTFLRAFGGAGDSSGRFSRPKGVAVDQLAHVYVVDAMFDNVQVFDGDGRFLLNWGELGEAPGRFWLPAGAAVDSDNRIYVADAYNQRVQVFQYVGEP